MAFMHSPKINWNIHLEDRNLNKCNKSILFLYWEIYQQPKEKKPTLYCYNCNHRYSLLSLYLYINIYFKICILLPLLNIYLNLQIEFAWNVSCDFPIWFFIDSDGILAPKMKRPKQNPKKKLYSLLSACYLQFQINDIYSFI